MKQMRLIIIAIFLHSICSAQESKIPGNGTPSYEETIEFLKLHFAHPDISGQWLNGGYISNFLYYDIEYKVVDITFSNCLLNIKYEKKTIVRENNQKFTPITLPKVESFSSAIDLSRVEEIVIWGSGYETWWVFGLSFNIKGQVSKTQMELPFVRRLGKITPNDMKNDQVYKAFNHLRKLCGAPEPIKF